MVLVPWLRPTRMLAIAHRTAQIEFGGGALGEIDEEDFFPGCFLG